MSKKKKDKKSTAKKIAKAQLRKKQKRKLRLIKTKSKPKQKYVEHSPMAEVDAPTGFRAVSMSQAVMEYSKSIFDFNNSESIDDMNQALQLSSLIWNYGIATESGNITKKITKEILDMIQAIWQVDRHEAQKLLDKFVNKRNKLFPPEIQVEGSPMMYMRKELSHLIVPFNYEELALTETILPPDLKDKEFIESLEAIDRYIQSEKDYTDWEDEYFSMEKKCNESFSSWLQKKGITGKLAQDFPFFVEIFMNFVYRYIHGDIIVFKSVQPVYIEEFLFDHVLRKVSMEPQEHVNWPPALKLFYKFLYEKEYLDDPAITMEAIDDFETRFIEVLKNRFS